MKRFFNIAILVFFGAGVLWSQPSERLVNIIDSANLIAEKEEEPLVKTIILFQSEIENFNTVEQAIINSMIAECLWTYLQQNRWEIFERTTLANPDLTDIQTWDTRLLLQQTIAYYHRSLQPREALQNLRVRDFKAILNLGDDEGEIQRPTMFDLLAHRAINAWNQHDLRLTQSLDQFLVDDIRYFFPTDFQSQTVGFTWMEVPMIDTLSLDYQILKTYQLLSQFHAKENNPNILIPLDLQRMAWVRGKAVFENADNSYQQYLENYLQIYPDSAATAQIYWALAEFHFELGNRYNDLISEEFRWEKQVALQYAELIEKRYPNTRFERLARALEGDIKRKTIKVQMQNVVLPHQQNLFLMRYTNVDPVYFSLYRLTDEDLKNSEMFESYSRLSSHFIDIYRHKKLDNSWEIALPDSGDFQENRIELSLPPLSAGYYVLFASPRKSVSDVEHVEAQVFGVSELTYVSNTTNSKMEGMVLNRKTGKPLSNVKVRLFSKNYDYQTGQMKEAELAMLTSAKNGRFEYSMNPNNNRSSIFVELQRRSDTLLAWDQSHWWHTYSESSNWRRQTFLFTDRAIYRPGQIVYFKGILVERNGDESRIVANTTTTVKLFDANYKEIALVEVRTNEFGSFSGNFVLPSRGLNGQFLLQTDNGTQFFSVEEYKRPSFEIVFEPLKNAYKLDEEAMISGVVKTYSGANLGHSLVNFNIVRTVNFPSWRRGWWFRPSEETVISQGVAMTDENGQFQILFTAYADKRIPANGNATYTFTVTVESTDVSGETQQNTQRVFVSQKALNISLNVRSFMDKTRDSVLQISSTNLSGEKMASQGTIKIYRLQPNKRLLRERMWDVPNRFNRSETEFVKHFPNDPFGDENHREKRERILVLEKNFNTELDEKFVVSGLPRWQNGDYVYTIETQDIFGTSVTNENFFTVFSPRSEKKTPLQQQFYTIIPSYTVEPGQTFSCLIGSATKVDVYYEIRGKSGVLEHKMISLNNEQRRIEFPIREVHRGNLSLQVWCVIDNRIYNTNASISVPFSNKNIHISFETFRDKLMPNTEETWTLQLLSNDQKPLQGEMLLSMYDASLDVFQKNHWHMDLNRYFQASYWRSNLSQIRQSQGLWTPVSYHYPPPPAQDALNFTPPPLWNYRFMSRAKMARGMALESVAMMVDEREISIEENVVAMDYDDAAVMNREVDGSQTSQESQVSDVFSPRTNLNETAFFFPHLRSDESGKINVSFIVPESLTRWRIQGLAHTQDLKIGIHEWSAMTQKNLMVTPNMPRFLREGDAIQLQARIINLVNEPISGIASLSWTLENQFGPISAEDQWQKEFSIPALQNTSVVWAQRFNHTGFLNLTFSAKADEHTDGEVRMIPVLSNRAMLTETMPMFANANSERTFSFPKLANPNSPTLENHRLTLEIATNPIWFAVQALPELSHSNSENSIALFGAYFSNVMAMDILKQNPEIKTVFNRWKMAESETMLRSNLEKNQELKSVLIDETPWLLQAEKETRQKQNIALYFDENNVRNLQSEMLNRLQKLQLPNGGFTWFPGGRGDLWNTQHIVHGLQKLHRRNIERDNFELKTMLQNALRFCDEQHIEWYRNNQKQNLTITYVSANSIQYLYLRHYFADEHPISPEMTAVLNIYDSVAKTTWRNQSRFLQGILALYFDLKNETKFVDDIMQNFSRLALKSPEFGMWWRYEPSWFWYESPIETQSQLIEVFEKLGRKEDVELMKQWLLTQKRTTLWRTRKASADAVYALMLGTPNLNENTEVDIQIGNEKITTPNTADAGSGYFTKFWMSNEIQPNQANVTIKNNGNSMVWGGLYWQYFENLDKVTPAETPLSVKKTLFRERPTDRGPILEQIFKDTMKIGDKITVRMEIRTDRNLDFVHLKDLRAAAFEPMEMLSGYRFQDGLFYYQEIKDVSMNFYFTHLPRGTYVFEYSLRVSQIGNFSNGYTTIQCLYAPEFSAQSQGERIIVN
ncbi:MAG: MG2 domain-containing protein [Bacteroidales bacterium]|nr:MG2 domain-containing protein [Bacteroidales bacterium]